MSLTITSYPEQIVNSDAATVSKWNALHHPIKFELHRQDMFTTNSLITSTTLLVETNANGDITPLVPIGSFVYLETLNGSGLFQVITQGQNLTSFAVNLNGVQGMVGSGFVNFQTKLNYFISTKIWGVDENNNYFLIGESINKPDVSGRATIDVSSFLKNIVDYVDKFTYNKLNKKDTTLGGRFNITYSENWTGFTGIDSALSTKTSMYFTNSVKQIQDLYGSNMGEYVPFANKGFDTKFLSDFKAPTYFVGFPFSLSFIYSESLFGKLTTKFENRKDINNAILTTNNIALNNNEALWVNRLMLDGNYPTTVKSVDVWLDNDGTLAPVEAIQTDYVQTDYTKSTTEPEPIKLAV